MSETTHLIGLLLGTEEDWPRAFETLLGSKGLRVELDVWGYDVPHDWPSWRRQLAHHLPRFV